MVAMAAIAEDSYSNNDGQRLWMTMDYGHDNNDRQQRTTAMAAATGSG
jgi:hypothetical protein